MTLYMYNVMTWYHDDLERLCGGAYNCPGTDMCDDHHVQYLINDIVIHHDMY